MCVGDGSPWCLLEISEAMRLQKPIVLLELKGPGREFSFEEAFALLDDLETNLLVLNAPAILELRAQTNQSFQELQAMLRQALEVARARGVPHLNING
jgi:hypothetical protein